MQLRIFYYFGFGIKRTLATYAFYCIDSIFISYTSEDMAISELKKKEK